MRTRPNYPDSQQLFVAEGWCRLNSYSPRFQPKTGWASGLSNYCVQVRAIHLAKPNRYAAQLFILEEMAWSDQAITAAEVISLQCFRDLFTEEALKPGAAIFCG